MLLVCVCCVGSSLTESHRNEVASKLYAGASIALFGFLLVIVLGGAYLLGF